MKSTISLTLKIEDINLILKALGMLPFSEVYAVIHEIHQQAQAQTESTEDQANSEGPENA